MRDVLAGFRHAVRSARRAPAFTVLAVAVLASGIGASTVMFTLVNAVLIEALPFDQPDRLVWMYNTRAERDRAPLSIPDLDDYRHSTALAGLAPFAAWTTNLTGAGTPERLDGVRVAGGFFPLLGTRAAIGRLLQPQDDATSARVAVITDALWRRRFAADPGIVGRDVSLNGAAYTVVGVLPPRFLFPFREADLAVPLALAADPRRADRGANFLRVVARLGPAVTVAQATADLDAIAQRLQRLYPDDDARKTGISLYPLHAEIVRDYRAMLWTLFASVGVLLLVGCVNLASLLLVRAAGRRVELAVRLSLGASRGALARHLAGEAAALALLGGLVGIVVAAIGLSAWRALGPADFPQMASIALDARALLFAAVVATLTALACGVAPAILASRAAAPMAGDSVRTTAGRSQQAVQRGFVAAQIAAATVLLVGMLLMARGLARLEAVPAGFAADEAVSLQLSLPPATYGNRVALTRFADAVYDRLAATPGIEAAGAVSLLPLSGLLSTADIAFPDRPAPPPDQVPQAHLRVAMPEYFDAAGIRLLDGRAFDEHDRQDGRAVAIVSRTFARRHWGDASPIGRQVRLAGTPSPPMDVVGVVGDVKQFGLDGPVTADLYVPLAQVPAFQVPQLAARMNWVVRGRGGAAGLARALGAAIAQVDATVAPSSPRTLAGLWRASLGSRRANVRLLEVFADVAAVLCALGVYGVASVSARARRRELAIRAALGASRRGLAVLMLRRELAPAVIGLAIGLALALGTAPVLFAGAFGVGPRDALTYAEAAAALFALALAASCLPVRRASAVNPSDVLRA
jgi:putative ABC transport system permease protein